MANLGEILTDEEIHEMIKKLDKDGDGQIDFEEFVGLMKMRAQERNERDPEEELRDAFNIFDADGSGFIDRNEVRLLMKKLAQDLTDEGTSETLLFFVHGRVRSSWCRKLSAHAFILFLLTLQRSTPSWKKLTQMATERLAGKNSKQSCFAKRFRMPSILE